MMRRKDREVSGREEIETIIRSCDVCHIAFADRDTPYMVTMNFGYKGGDSPCFYFHCARSGRKLEMMRKNRHVFFELDTGHELFGGEKACDWGMKFMSVTGTGELYEIKDQEERTAGLDCIMDRYGVVGPHIYNDKVFSATTVLKLEISEMTGKRKQ